MYIIDSNILIAELLTKYTEDEEMYKYLLFYRRIPLMRRVLPDYILNEFELFVMHALPVRFSMKVSEKNELHDVVVTYLRQLIANCTLLTTDQQTMKTAFSLYNQKDFGNSISFTDCLLLAAANQNAYTILSNDAYVQKYADELHISYYKIIENQKNISSKK